ncbi:hypothetical protein POW83_06600 [Escherichia coli]|jgi:hypothetical protein
MEKKTKTRVKALYRNIKNERFFTVFIGGLAIIVSNQHPGMLLRQIGYVLCLGE